MIDALAEALGIASATTLIVSVACLVCRALNWAPVNITVHIHTKVEP